VLPLPIPGDFDDDKDVDQEDFGFLQTCLSGSAGGILAGCAAANLDGDSDVDQIDISKFFGCLSGAGVPGDPNCLTE